MNSSTTSWSWDGLPRPPGSFEPTPRRPFFAPEESDTPPPQPRQQDHASSERQRQNPQDPGPGEAPPNPNPNQRPRRNYRERTCRICLETVQPLFRDQAPGVLRGFMGEGSKPVYISPDDPALGRLISPCKCKGSQRYVHEGCLDAWRKANPGGGANTNFFTCPTCKYEYRIGRLAWARLVQSRLAQVWLTVVIFACAIFLLGFVAEPIFSLWNDPVGTIADTVAGVVDDVEARREPIPARPDEGGWLNHFVNGFLSLGIIGFAKYFIGMTPWQWWHVRSSGIMGGGRRGAGNRNRVENLNWALIMIGALSFVFSVWKAVGWVSGKLLQKAGDTVLDVGGDDDEEAEEEED